MTASPAAQLARLKTGYPAWAITRSLPGGPVSYSAVEIATGRRIRTATLAELESGLQERGPASLR